MITFIAYVVGFMTAVALISVLNGNKQEERDNELQEAYNYGREEGYKVGFMDGLENKE